jgi:hypothetical protein
MTPDWIQTNKFIGSCPYCGGRVFENDFIRFELDEENRQIEIVRCLHCRNEVHKENLIPF